MLKNIFKAAWRTFLRQRVNTTINVLGLAVGITVCLIIFLLVRYELTYDRNHPDGDRIYRVVTRELPAADARVDAGKAGPRGDGGKSGGARAVAAGSKGEPVRGFVPMPVANGLRSEVSGFETVAGIDLLAAGAVIVPQDGKQSRVFEEVEDEPYHIVIAGPEYFAIFPYHWLAGNPATALKDPFRVVLTESEATRYFGRMEPDQWLGRKLIYADSLGVTVSGIVGDWKENSDVGFQDIISNATVQPSFLKDIYGTDNWGNWDFRNYVYVKLAPGASPARIERQLQAFLDRRFHQEEVDRPRRVLALQPLADVHFNEKYIDAFRKASLPTLYGLAAIAVFILLIAAINFINLATAQSVRRAREIGVRKVLGGRRGALVLQFLCETLILVLMASALALLIAGPLLTVFQSLLPRGVHLVVFQWPTLLFVAALSIVTCLLAGFYPARVLSAYQPVLSLKGQGIRQLNNKSYLRRALIVFQFTVSLIFIIGTLFVAKQIRFVLNSDLGFDHDAIVEVGSGPDGPTHRRAVLADKFREIPGVEMIARSIGTPLARGHNGTGINLQSAPDHKVDASFDCIDTNYLRLYDMNLVAGRDLFASDSMREFLINETCARELGFPHPADALGKLVEIGMNNGHGQIVGVVKDFHFETMREPIKPFFMTSFTPAERHYSVKLATAGLSGENLAVILGRMEKAYKEVYPEGKFDYRFFDETIAQLYDKERKMAAILNIAMGIAIIISCLGLFGLAAFVAEQRTKEIGIRKVLGASVSGIVTMLSGDFLWLVALAILIASPVAWYFMHRWLEGFAYRAPISWWIYAVAGLAAIAIALLTVSFQAMRAARANPVESLRSE